MRRFAWLASVSLVLSGCSGDFVADAAENGRSEGVVGINPQDKDLAQAIAQAKAEFPKFRDFWSKRKPDDTFMVKVKFSGRDKDEHMWVLITSFRDSRLRGTLDNEPVTLTHMKKGDKANLHVDQVDDWVVIRDGEPHGYFSLPVMEKYGSPGFK